MKYKIKYNIIIIYTQVETYINFIFSELEQTAEYDYIGYKTTNNNNNNDDDDENEETNTFILYAIVKF